MKKTFTYVAGICFCLFVGYLLAGYFLSSLPRPPAVAVEPPAQQSRETIERDLAREATTAKKSPVAPESKPMPAPIIPAPTPHPAPTVAVSGNTQITSFAIAKNRLETVFSGIERTFYCGCPYQGKTVDAKTCGISSARYQKRLTKLEWEHVLPASLFGKNLPEWSGHPACVDKKGRAFKGRKCAQAQSARFNLLEADMYNLRPSSGALNAVRSDHVVGIIPGEKREFGRCDFEDDGETVEVADQIRGDVARIMLYMESAYPDVVIYDTATKLMLVEWNRGDPVSEEEYQISIRIERIQGNKNPFVTDFYRGEKKVH